MGGCYYFPEILLLILMDKHTETGLPNHITFFFYFQPLKNLKILFLASVPRYVPSNTAAEFCDG